jgi:hypothetical protein
MTTIPSQSRPSAQTAVPLIAYPTSPQTLDLSPAGIRRAWMDETPERFANRCLPLLIANQSGWLLSARHTVRATWDGGTYKDATVVEILDDAESPPAVSHFGVGIVTWTIPYLFRTPPGWNLLARGPANEPLDGAYALEGIVETDWSPATFTMNWKLTRPGLPVTFEKGRPICMIVPQRRGELESFDPVVVDLEDAHDLNEEYCEWRSGRAVFLEDLRTGVDSAVRQKWQRDYFRGIHRGVVEQEHQTKRTLRGFREENPQDSP